MVNLRGALTQASDWGARPIYNFNTWRYSRWNSKFYPGYDTGRKGNSSDFYNKFNNKSGFSYPRRAAIAKGAVLGREIGRYLNNPPDRRYRTNTGGGYAQFSTFKPRVSWRPRSLGNAPRYTSSRRRIYCYRCGLPGHIARYCRVYIR